MSYCLLLGAPSPPFHEKHFDGIYKKKTILQDRGQHSYQSKHVNISNS
jgi:hypothetical protein